MKMNKIVALVLAFAMTMSMGAIASAEGAGAIKLGLIGPMTGAAASYGTSVAQGAAIAVEEINALRRAAGAGRPG